MIGGLSSFTSAFGFDDLYRPTSATDPTGVYSWSYDADNNRLSQTVNGVTAAYTVDAANRLTSVGGVPVTTDANGNILVDNTGKSYQWDARGRLTSVSQNGTTLASYTYATNDVRSSMTEAGVTTTFTLDGRMCVNEATGGVNTPTLFGPTGPLERGGQWFTPDASGSVATVTGSSGNAIAQNCYGVFGQVMTTNPSSGDPLQFLGGMAEPSTGLDAIDSGFYEPDLGRMLSGSPASTLGGMHNPLGDLSGSCSNYDWLANGLARSIDISLTTIGGFLGNVGGGAAGAALGGAVATATDGLGAVAIPAGIAVGRATGTLAGGLAGHLAGQAVGAGVGGLIRLLAQSQCTHFAAAGPGTGSTGGTDPFVPDLPPGELSSEEQGAVDATVQAIKDNVTPPWARSNKWGSVFRNAQQRLPFTGGQTYAEYDVQPAPGTSPPGPRRVVVGSDGVYYYTQDHYASFWRLP